MKNKIEHLIEDYTQELYTIGSKTVNRLNKVPNSGRYNHEKNNLKNGVCVTLTFYDEDKFPTMEVNNLLIRCIEMTEPRLQRLEARVEADKLCIEKQREKIKNHLVINNLVPPRYVYGR